MVFKVNGVSRRKLYEFMIVFESFLLELENYIKYESNREFNNVIETNNFEKGLFDIFNKCVCMSNIFFEQKVILDQIQFNTDVLKRIQESEQEVKLLIEKEDVFEHSISSQELYELHTILKNMTWSENLASIKAVFKKAETFHSCIISILEYESIVDK